MTVKFTAGLHHKKGEESLVALDYTFTIWGTVVGNSIQETCQEIGRYD